MCGAKGYGFELFWFEMGTDFNHFGLSENVYGF